MPAYVAVGNTGSLPRFLKEGQLGSLFPPPPTACIRDPDEGPIS